MEPSLVVLAAGMGSRYGGIKQIEKVGPNGESLIDYSIYNALKAGFKKIVMVIRRDIQEDLQSFFQGKIPSSVSLEWVFQELDNLPSGYQVPAHREKPWGTGHAVLLCKDVVQEPFAMINGDDYYSYEALQEIASFLSQVDPSAPHYALVGYELFQTLSPNGSVSRGVCQVDEHNNLIFLEEHKKVSIVGNDIVSELDEGTQISFTGKEPTSMNLFGFTPAFFSQLEKGFLEFLAQEGTQEKSEFFVPSYLGTLITQSQASAHVLYTNSQWFGITYQADKEEVQSKIKTLLSKNVYPPTLWQ